ncbi:adenine deaminase C-terminal domain-containing protein [Brevibacillus sp. SYSU BS000544]|uniref:adenine deaminase C-terminal domain-containing protein n=1 Tax=Brevibacillus sp. SYSU BS000544 TaxID=3416443 RepID=UPI003CE48ADD
MRVRSLSSESYTQLLRTSRNLVPASMWIKGGTYLDVYLKQWRKGNIVIANERIAYVGEREPLVNDQTKIIDASGQYLVPGYIEPHAHPFQWYNPLSLGDFALTRGTTTLISDTLILHNTLPQDAVERIMEIMQNHPVKQFFWGRIDPQSQKQEMKREYSFNRLQQMLEHPCVVQAGELTDWGGILSEQEEQLQGLLWARDLGKRVEGHHPGASWDTLNVASAIGVTACHESMTVEEVINRLRLGMYATLRHSSIRPDLPQLIKGLIEQNVPWGSRLMLTTDGSTPPMLGKGLMDYCISLAIEAGAPPEEAYVMATLNPATYYGMDAEIGGIAPGRIADILLLESPTMPTPVKVIANGRVWAEQQQLTDTTMKIDWTSYPFPSRQAEWDEDAKAAWFRMQHPGEAIPVMDMLNAVITKVEMMQLPCHSSGEICIADNPELAFVCLLDARGKRISQAIIRGFGSDIQAIASTYTASGDWIVIGRDPEMMAKAFNQVKKMDGGIVVYDRGGLQFQLELPIAGMISEASVDELSRKGTEFCIILQSKGHQHIDPIYSLLFLSATHLPFVRLTDEGLYDVKQRKILVPSIEIF